MVVTILVASMIITRRKDFKILGSSRMGRGSILDDPDSARSSDELLWDDGADDDEIAAAKHYPKKRNCCFGMVVRTPNTSRFANNVHSRILQKFPFLMEMFYWVITYLFYRMTKVVSQNIFSKTGIWDVAQENGLRLLEIEQLSFLSFLFPFTEHDVQHWFMNGHQSGLTYLNRFYALVHVPGTVG